jgi:hypothetical protein
VKNLKIDKSNILITQCPYCKCEIKIRYEKKIEDSNYQKEICCSHCGATILIDVNSDIKEIYIEGSNANEVGNVTNQIMNNIKEQKKMGEKLIEMMNNLHGKVGGIVESSSKASRKIEILLLIVSILTSGALWILLSISLSKLTLWVGAIFSTITSGLNIFQIAFGPKKEFNESLNLYRDIGNELAHMRASKEIDETRFWDQYKAFETRKIQIK